MVGGEEGERIQEPGPGSEALWPIRGPPKAGVAASMLTNWLRLLM